MNDFEKLISFLERTGSRIEYKDMWMVKDSLTKQWVVYQRKLYAKKTTELARTDDLEYALFVLDIKINYDHSWRT